MGIVDFLRAPLATVTVPADGTHYDPWTDTGTPFQTPAPSVEVSVGDFREAAENVFSAHYLVYAACTAYAEIISSFPAKVYAQMGDSPQDREVVRSDPLVDLLNQPNDHQDGCEFIYALVLSLLIGGESPIEKVRNRSGKRTAQLLHLRPDKFGPIVNEREGLVGYQYIVGNRGFSYDPEEVIFYKLPNPTNEWRGLSPLTAARLSVETDLDAERYNRNLLKNGAIPMGTLETDEPLTAKERRAIRGEWREVHAGVRKSGMVAVLDQGLKFNGTGFNSKDLQWLEGRQHDQESILAVYKISPAVLGMVRNVNYSNADAMLKGWYKGPVRAMCRRIERKLTLELARSFDESYFIEFLMDDVLRPDFAERAEAGSKAWWVIPDEKRKWENLPPIEGGDKMYVPVNMAAGGSPVQELSPATDPEPAKSKGVVLPFGR